jgi:hypothetical protein
MSMIVMIVTAAVVVIAVVVVVVVMVVVMAVIAVSIAAYIAWFVFLRSHKVHRPIAGVVILAMLAPIFGMARRHM